MKLFGSICAVFILCVLTFPAQSECGIIGLFTDLYDQAASTASNLFDELSKVPGIIVDHIPSLTSISDDSDVLTSVTGVISNPIALPTSDEAPITVPINDATLAVEDQPALAVEDPPTLAVEDPPTLAVEDLPAK